MNLWRNKNDRASVINPIAYLHDRPIHISKRWLMLTIMFCSFTLPISLFATVQFVFKAVGQRATFSEYVYTPAAPIFIIYAIFLGSALFAYQGEDQRSPLSERFTTNMAALGAFMTAAFPANTCREVGASMHNAYGSTFFGDLHLIGATFLALGLGLHITFSFPTVKPSLDRSRWDIYSKNAIYIGCGYALFICTGFIAIDHLLQAFLQPQPCQTINQLEYIFFLEVIMVGSTGIAWSTKYYEERSKREGSGGTKH